MKRLIKRYIIKAQCNKESDEVNEGKDGLLKSVQGVLLLTVKEFKCSLSYSCLCTVLQYVESVTDIFYHPFQ